MILPYAKLNCLRNHFISAMSTTPAPTPAPSESDVEDIMQVAQTGSNDERFALKWILKKEGESIEKTKAFCRSVLAQCDTRIKAIQQKIDILSRK